LFQQVIGIASLCLEDQSKTQSAIHHKYHFGIITEQNSSCSYIFLDHQEVAGFQVQRASCRKFGPFNDLAQRVLGVESSNTRM
jgi:hypothetical protein